MRFKRSLPKETGSIFYSGRGKISQAFDARLRQFARYLQGRSAAAGRGNRTYLLVLFCLAWSALLVGILYRSLEHPSTVLSITPVKVPGHITIPEEYDYAAMEVMTRVRQYKQYLDSLKANNPRVFDSIQRRSAGLMDSLSFIDHYYLKHK